MTDHFLLINTIINMRFTQSALTAVDVAAAVAGVLVVAAAGTGDISMSSSSSSSPNGSYGR